MAGRTVAPMTRKLLASAVLDRLPDQTCRAMLEHELRSLLSVARAAERMTTRWDKGMHAPLGSPDKLIAAVARLHRLSGRGTRKGRR